MKATKEQLLQIGLAVEFAILNNPDTAIDELAKLAADLNMTSVEVLIGLSEIDPKLSQTIQTKIQDTLEGRKND